MTSEQFPKGPNMSPTQKTLAESIESLNSTRAKFAAGQEKFKDLIRNDLPVEEPPPAPAEEESLEEKYARLRAEEEKVFGPKGPHWKDRD